jgi:hypothetical protein
MITTTAFIRYFFVSRIFPLSQVLQVGLVMRDPGSKGAIKNVRHSSQPRGKSRQPCDVTDFPRFSTRPRRPGLPPARLSPCRWGV